jgi:rubrerythrin
MTTFVDAQAHLVDGIKRRAVEASLASPRGEAWILSAYLASEEQAEASSLARTAAAGGPPWLARLIERQLEDEARHARLLRERLAALGAPRDEAPGREGLFARGKLWLFARACRGAGARFAAGEIVPLLACALRLERTGVRMFTRHLAVLDASRRGHETAEMLRAILADERRHVRGCETALSRLVAEHERPALAALDARIARADRAFGVSSSVAMWAIVTAHRLRDRVAARGRS